MIEIDELNVVSNDKSGHPKCSAVLYDLSNVYFFFIYFFSYWREIKGIFSIYVYLGEVFYMTLVVLSMLLSNFFLPEAYYYSQLVN